MFQLFKKKEDKMIVLGSPVKGKAVLLKEVSDPTFGEEILGKGIAIKPTEGKIYAPADATIELLFDTLHAVSMTTDDGVEILVHVGLETVGLKGRHFEAHVTTGAKVSKGDLLMSVDLDALKAEGFDTITPMIICNTDDYQSVEAEVDHDVEPGEDILYIKLNK